MPINTKAKGSRNERRSMALLEAAGYAVTKSGASLGIWDLVGISATDFVVVQVKTGRNPVSAEMETLKDFRVPPNCKKLLHVWKPRQRLPDVKEVV